MPAFVPLAGRSSSYGGALCFVEDVSEHVVGDVGHAYFHLGPSNPDGPDEELHLVLLPGKDMLDRGPDLGSSPVCPRHRFRHGFALRLSLVNVRLQAVVLQPFLIGLRAIGTVGPDGRGGIVLGHDVPELSAVMGARRRHRPSPDEAMRPVDPGVVLSPR